MRRGTGTAQGPPAFAFPLHFGPGAANPNPPSTHDDEPPQEWTPPDPPGVTLRERVERRERDAGLRCSDSSCGIGPSDDDPFIEVPENAQRRIPITGPDGKTACSHTFHPTCLVSAQRSRRGWLEPQLAEGKEDAIEVSCSLCRADGTVPPAEWLEGSILPLD
ncbi:hypothetical protein C8F01DRAFT_995719 [Mycena amicta]|nr:hypothetical protein C8F01DRAFT_995719 [Mycena amicta]